MVYLTIKDLIICHFTDPPSPPMEHTINEIQTNTLNGTSMFLISWSQSKCAVQYVVTIINSSDDRVYPNITTSNTNTTVTLPTGVEFCVTLVAVDNIGRRGPDTTPVCYRECLYTSTFMFCSVVSFYSITCFISS